MSDGMNLIKARCEMEALLCEKLAIQFEHSALMMKYDMATEEARGLLLETEELKGQLMRLASKLRRV